MCMCKAPQYYFSVHVIPLTCNVWIYNNHTTWVMLVFVPTCTNLFIVNIDLTITTEKLVEFFGTMEERWVDSVGFWLELPKSKRDEVDGIYQSPTQRRDAYLDLYVSSHPCPSWKTVAEALNTVFLHHQADVVENTYVQGIYHCYTHHCIVPRVNTR